MGHVPVKGLYIRFWFCLAAWLAPVVEGSCDVPPRAAVFRQVLPGQNPQLADPMTSALKAAGYKVDAIDADALRNEDILNAEHYDLLALAKAGSLPIEAAEAIELFLDRGGDVIVLGAPMFEHPLIRSGKGWMKLEDAQQEVARQKPEKILFDFENGDLKSWKHDTNRPEPPSTLDVESGALHAVIPDLTNWDNFRVTAKSFAPGHALTRFRAKGGPNTQRLAVEWKEKDGTRWIATVDLTGEWKDYALPPEAFVAWDPPHGRGGSRDRLNVMNVVQWTVGMALTHTFTTGRQEFWIDDIGTAPDPFAGRPLPKRPDFKAEILAPSYLFYPITTASTVVFPDGGPVVPVQSGTLALHPRPRGAGYRQKRLWRWEPLLEAGERGTIAAMMIHSGPPSRGGVWACFTPSNADFYAAPAVQKMLRETAEKMKRGVFLIEGGSQYFTVFEDQSVRLGARVANVGKEQEAGLRVRIRITPEGVDSTPVYDREWPVTVDSGREKTVEDIWQPKQWPESGYRVTTELLADGQVIDQLSHLLHVWRPNPNPEYIQTLNGGFQREGEPWKVHGINYMPSTGIGQSDRDLYEHWLGAGAYDPVTVERDLRRIKGMGFNAVSIFVYHQSLEAQHLLDFLRLCDELDLKVNLGLRPGTPVEFQWEKMKELIEHFRLAQNDTVFAYDLAWEPNHWDYKFQKKNYEADWKKWVSRRYGSIEAAEKVWNFPFPHNGVPPLRNNLKTDRLKLVNDYRAFLDEFLEGKYAAARKLVQSLDPHHAVSFRKKSAGDPTFRDERMVPYDLYGLRNAVDVWEPEAYGLIGNWERVRTGLFTAAYARLCDPKKPLLWAEAGFDVWDPLRMEADPGKLSRAAAFYKDFYRMLKESGADGVFFWWYAGGCRIDEKSDFGVLNPDGTDRPVTPVIRTEGAAFLSAPKPPAPDSWVEIDRDASIEGFVGMYDDMKSEFWRAADTGKTPGLKWKREPGAKQ